MLDDHFQQVRITLSKDGRTVVTASPLASNFSSDPTAISTPDPGSHPDNFPTPPVHIYMDKEPTQISFFTSTKTTLREVYDQAKARNKNLIESTPDGEDSDVLMYNQDDQITEATISNVAFYRAPYWLTPSTTSGCLPGVMRAWLLKNDQIREDSDEILTTESIHEGEWVLLFNGVQGCRLGKICRRT